MEPLPIMVGGEWRRGRGDVYASRYPADDTVNAELAAASPADVADAIEAADQAWRKPDWRGLKPHERANILHKVSALIRSRAEELAQLQRRDNGKPISETRLLVASAAGTFQFYAAACETFEETVTPSRGDYMTMSVYDPIGVVAAITPWNSPIASDAQKLAPALAAGNAVILKPAEVTPLVALELGRICEQAGVPRGVVSVLPGKGSIIGDAIVKHPKVRKVAFTGGTTTGRALAHQAAEKLMPVTLELGGKSPTIVFEDADIDHAVNGVLFGIFSSSGESCIAGSRLFVHESIHGAFMERLVAGARALRVGDPADPKTQMGPLITMQHRQTIESYVELGLKEGGKILAGGARPKGPLFDKGSFYSPTVFTGLANSARLCQEEIFGPVVVAMPFSNEKDLVREANDSVFGLAAGIWTRDYKRAWRVGRQLEAGTIWINTYKMLSISTPFTGIKQSGIGSDKGRLGILHYMNQKSLYWGMNEAPLPWANPA
jgi:betaine-aldehyde dehydrogenase